MKTILTLLCFCVIQVASAQTADELVDQGNQLYRQAQWAPAEAAYRRALQKESAHNEAQYNLANALQKQKKFEEAAEVLQKLYSTTSNKSVKAAAAYNGGVAQTKQKKLEASIEGYKNALRIDPNDKQARENLQKALAELKKKQQQDQQQQKSSSSMDQNSADQKLKLLQDKEKELQQRLQNQKKGTGGGGSKDW
jgi:Ca-activated chloride channel homolog